MKTTYHIIFSLLFLILSMFYFIGCQDATFVENPVLVEEELDEMSIFHLPANWSTQNGEQITLEDLKGETLVTVMIYTACKTACPRLVADMRNIEAEVSAKSKEKVKYIMVSIDPKNDSPEKLKTFAKDNAMDDDKWLFLQGTEETVRDFANILAVKYKQISPIDFSHSNIISVFDTKGVLKYQKEGLGMENNEIVSQILEINRR
jgi:protein SCO1